MRCCFKAKDKTLSNFLADRAITFARHRIARKVLQYCMLHHQFYLLFCHQSENTRKSVRLVRRLEQLGIASSPAKKELGLDSLKDSDTYFFTIIFLNFNGFLQWKRKKCHFLQPKSVFTVQIELKNTH